MAGQGAATSPSAEAPARLLGVPGASSQFIFQDSDRVPGHTLKIIILGPRPDGSPVDFGTVHRFVGSRMARFEPFCWRAVNPPLRFGHPFFVTTGIDLSYHLRRATAKPPGGERELAAVISEATTGSLDTSRPLWRVWYVDGLEGGRRALIIKMHHALADGGASARLIDSLFDETLAAPPPVDPRPVSRRELFGATLQERARSLLTLPLLVLASLMSFGRRTVKRVGGAKKTAKPFEAPPMPYNEPLTRRRAFGYTHVDLADIKTVRKALDVSFNAVFMAICATAARDYAVSIGLDVDRPLTVSVPVAIGEDQHMWGNRVATWYVIAATDIEDPVERLLAIDDNAAASRVNFELGNRDLQERWMQHWRLWAVPTYYLTRVTAHTSTPPSFNYICSNVRGPRAGSLDGAPMVDLASVGPLVHGLGLNFTGWSFGDRLTVSVVLCPDHVPDVWDIVDRIPPALEELVEATRAAT